MINNIIQTLTDRGNQLATTRLEERRVKCLNIISLVMVIWLFSIGIIRLAIGDTFLFVLDFVLAILCLGVYYWHRFNLKHARVMLVLLAQAAVASQMVIALNANFIPAQHLKISLIVLSFFILIFFDGYLLYLFYSLNVILFYGPYFFMGEVNVISLLHGTYLFLAPFLVIKCFMEDIRFYEKELFSQQEQLENQSEILKQNDRLKSRFFANITHELRTPLTLILGPLKELKETENIKNPGNVHLIEKHADKLLLLVNQILDLSKAQFGFKRLTLSHSNISNYTKSLCSIFKSHSQNKNITFIGDFPEQDIYGLVHVESLDKILTNLISNAIKFSEENDKVKVSLKLIREKHRWVEVQVIDTGKGIEEKELGFIFEPYYHTTSGAEVSTGIGLALVKELMDNHQGKIRVTSEMGVGTKFNLKIPIDEQFYIDHEVEYSIIETKNGSEHPHINYNINESCGPEKVKIANNENDYITILLVEDNEDMRAYIQQVLAGSYQLILAKDGQEGIDIAKTKIPDIIVSDVMMPMKSGIELTKELKQNISTSHIPIILLTAKFNPESKIEGYQADADDYIVKPFDKKELLCRIDNLIRSRKRLQQKYNDQCIFQTQDLREFSIEESFIKRLTEIIFNNIDNADFSVKQLAKEIGMSRSQLYRKTYALTGLSISQFIRSKRLKYAYDLLEKNVGTVSEIAYKAGFSSPNYFNKCFKEMYDICPGEAKGGKQLNAQLSAR